MLLGLCGVLAITLGGGKCISLPRLSTLQFFFHKTELHWQQDDVFVHLYSHGALEHGGGSSFYLEE